MNSAARAVLRITCPDRPGIVAEVSSLLFRLGINIHHADQHLDADANLFFQRIEFPAPTEWEAFRREAEPALQRLGMTWSLRRLSERLRVAVLVSKYAHCAFDVLDRHRAGELACEIPLVISNHPDLGEDVSRRGYNFFHEAIEPGKKHEQERRILARLERERIDLVVLARYMQILSADFVAPYSNRLINIHHSFLPAFAGAEPYRQAFRKGVKLVGATSHYVTAELDEGPIIAQGVTRVSHRDGVRDLERKGRDLERVVFAEAIRCHLEDRIIAYGNKTVVFE